MLRNAGLVAAVLAGVALGAWLAGRGDSAPPTTTVTRPPRTALNPRGALLLANHAGRVLVGIAARPGGPVDVVVIPSDLGTVPASEVSARIARVPASAASVSCGTRCYRFPLSVLAGGPERLLVDVRGSRVTFDLPARLPPQAPLFRAAARRMAALPSVQVRESLSSGASAIRARFDLQAPDRMHYTTSSGQEAVVIGERRWDRVGGRWRESDYQRIQQPAYMWEGAHFARLLGRERLGGRPVRVLSAFRPHSSYPAWFRLYVTPANLIERAEMIAPAHFMVDRFSRFGRPMRIRPPR